MIKYISILILGILIGAVGFSATADTQPESRFSIGDQVKTINDWTELQNHEPIEGNVTFVKYEHENTFISVDGGELINEDWFEDGD